MITERKGKSRATIKGLTIDLKKEFINTTKEITPSGPGNITYSRSIRLGKGSIN